MTVSNLERSSLVAFARDKAAEERKWAKSRRETSVMWVNGTEADYESSRLMAQRMMGRKIKRKTKAEREALSAAELRIADKHDAEATVYEAIADMLEARS